MIHGLCEHQGRYDYVAGCLNRQGFGTYRFDLGGHGRSGGTRTNIATRKRS
ncbi:MAG: serine aminopeptidase domain-containing protein [Christensenellales bacterium]